MVIPVVNSNMCSLEISDSNVGEMKNEERDAQFFEGTLEANGI